MAQIQKNYENYGELLGGGSLDAASGTLFNSAVELKVNKNQRTILIGIGGAGLSTINYIKGMLNERLEPTWSKYIAFLAIDSDNTMLKNMKNINNSNDFVSTTHENADTRMNNADKNPQAVRRSMNPPLNDPALKWFGDGSGQRRLMGRAKLHDKEPGKTGVDEEIVSKLKKILGSLAPAGLATEYSVYVIGSICGGTCSGAIQDMPALIRHALEPSIGGAMKLYCMLYVPDAMVGLMSDDKAKKAMANGYAALKEINYYQGVVNRPGYPVKFAYNDPANPEIEITKYFDEPMLIGNSMGAVKDADKMAQQTVAEYLVNLFTENAPQSGTGLGAGMTLQSVLHNATGGSFQYRPGSNQTLEAVGEAHDFPYVYGTIGFAKAAAPQKMVIAYAVDQICKMTGFKADPDAAPITGTANGALPPFKGNLFTASEGTLQAKQLLQPLSGLLDKVHNGSFNFAAEFNNGQAAEWKKINAGEYDSTKAAVNNRVTNATAITQMNLLRDDISALYTAYTTGVTAFIKNYGPLAYVNVFNGNFIKEGEKTGTGIREMLDNVMRGYNFDGSVYTKFKKSEETAQQLQNIEAIIRGTKKLIDFTGDKKAQAGTWMNNYNAWVKSRIDEARNDVAVGANKYIDEYICKKAIALAEQLEMFGHILNEMSDIYSGFGKKVETFEAFSKTKDSLCEINLAASDEKTYDWLKKQVDTKVVSINTKQLRSNIIDDFMANPAEWLDSNDAIAASGINLKNQSQPIKARSKFDALVSDSMGAFVLNVSIMDIFKNLQAQGRSYDIIAQEVMEDLRAQSKVQFNGETGTGTKAVVVMIPAVLGAGGGEGLQISAALKAACHDGELIFETDDADGILMYNCINELPVYKLASLKAWEKAYQLGVNSYNDGLHGLSPSVQAVQNGMLTTFEDRMVWRDYPAITVEADPKQADANGVRSHEGDIRVEMDEVLKEAEKWGVINYREDPKDHTWTCVRTYLDKSRNWEFDVASCGQDDEGFLPTGKALMDEIMMQNGLRKDQEIQKYQKQVALASNASLMSGKYPSEALAREYVPRILRAHVDMYLEIQDTLAKFTGDDGWGEAIEQFNNEIGKMIMAGKEPVTFVRMMLAGILAKDVKKVWKVTGSNKKAVVLLNEAMNKFLKGSNKVLATNLTSYYVYKTLKQKLGEDFAEYGEYAEAVIDELMANEEMEALEANMEAAGQIMEEAEFLTGNGANLEDPDASFTIKFKNFIKDYAANEDEQHDIVSFYINAVAALTEE